MTSFLTNKPTKDRKVAEVQDKLSLINNQAGFKTKMTAKKDRINRNSMRKYC